MKTLIFWNKWSQQTKVLYTLSLLVLLTSILYYTSYYFIGLDAILDWDVEIDIKNISTNIDIFKHKLFDVPVASENYVVLQYFKASMIKINYLSAGIFMFLIAFAGCLGITVVTTYKKLIWFIPGSALFTGWLASLKLDVLSVFGLENNVLLTVLLISYLGLAYIFHTVYTKITFLKRFLSFALVTLIFGLIIIFFAEVKSPIVHLSNFGLIVPAIVTVLFIFVIGYEVLHIAITTITYSKNSNPWVIPMNFLVVTILYIGNMIVYYMYKDGQISWTLPYNVYLFFPICAVLGIWTHRKRSVLYDNILPFAPGGAFLFLSMAIVSFATIGYILSTSLSPAIKIFEYVFLTSQIAFGLGFFAYTVRNFYKPMVHNMPVYKMIFDPKLMLHGALRGIGLVIMVFFVGKKAYMFKDQLKGANYSLKADSYLSDGQLLLATQNYREVLRVQPGEHHACYSLASIYMMKQNYAQASNILKTVNKNETSEYLFASLSAAYKSSDQSLKDLFVLQDAVRKFPDSAPIANNVALIYHKMGYADSAVFYLKKAMALDKQEIVNSNLLAIAALDKIGDGTEKLQIDENYLNSEVYMANAYALANVLGTKLTKEFDVTTLTDENVGGEKLSLVNNYVDNNLYNVPIELNQRLQYWVDSVIYDLNLDNARFILGKSYFYNKELTKGLEVLETLTKHASTMQYPFYANFTGVLELKAGMINKAHKNVVGADQSLQLSDDNFARETASLLSMETLDTAYAEVLYLQMTKTHPEKNKEYKAMYEAINGDHSSTDFHKAVFVLFDKRKTPEHYFDVIETMQNENLKSIVVLDLIERELNNKKTQFLDKLWRLLPSTISGDVLFHKSNLLHLRTHQVFGDYVQLEQAMKEREVSDFDSRWLTYFNALLNAENKQDVLAKQTFNKSINLFPENDEIWGSFIDFYTKKGDSESAYDLCANYLQSYPPTELMLRRYVDVSINNNLLTFADDAVQDLKYYMSKSDYTNYLFAYKQKLKDLGFDDDNLTEEEEIIE